MKVLHVISGNDYGGGAAYVLNICRAPVYLFENYLCCIGEGPLTNMAKQNGVNVLKLNMKDIFKGRLIEFIMEHSIEVVNFHGAKANMVHLFIKNKLLVPTVVTVHSDYRYDFTNNKLKYLFFTPLSILGLKSFQNYICVSKCIMEILESKNFIGNKTIIGNGINADYYTSLMKTDEIKSMYKIDNQMFIYGVVARMHPIKNHKSIIKAFKKLRSEFDNIKLLLVGDGPLLEPLQVEVIEGNIKEDVIFSGFQKNSLDYLRAFDISVIASFSEGGSPPLAILESGLVGKPVICSDIGNMSEIISKDIGYLVNPNSVEDIYDKMRKAYLHKDMLEEMGNKFNNIVTKNYTIEKFWDKYKQVYSDLLSKNVKNKA